jgi:uncharacterized membrane protein YphA (DoxX/SURF4 family)
MRSQLSVRDIPGRAASGVFILHAGLDKWNGSSEQATAVHGMAANAYPFLKPIPPERFLRLLAAGEIATGTLLLAPFVSSTVAGLALSGFSGALLTMYLKTPTMHKPGSVWPTPAGTAVSKDVWLLGIGLGLLTHRRARKVREDPDR